ncbi:MAG: DUF1003 domain-containing protein [Bacillota bacterium]|nr:DUF1003 domain-containing protein [Bacillota bacterium]
MSLQNREEILLTILQDAESDLGDDELLHMMLSKTVSQDVNRASSKNLRLRERAADKMAKFAGSWTFILIFLGCIVVWIIFNSFILLSRGYDPYPYILLNLILSCIAAIQAPVIMMSQNRKEQKDRERSENDYKVNLKSELIIKDLHDRLDLLIDNQNVILARLDGLESIPGKKRKG